MKFHRPQVLAVFVFHVLLVPISVAIPFAVPFSIPKPVPIPVVFPVAVLVLVQLTFPFLYGLVNATIQSAQDVRHLGIFGKQVYHHSAKLKCIRKIITTRKTLFA